MLARKRTPIALALAALGLVTLWPGASPAVHLSSGGTGQVLIFPYYTVRADYFTALSVSNTQDNTKLVKVRFLEAMNGREVLAFNLYLAPNDTWTAGIVATAQGAKLVSNDNSCVSPANLFAENAKVDGLWPNEFSNANFTGANLDAPAAGSLDRTREGYFEILEMGVIDNDSLDGNAVTGIAATIVAMATPNSAGLPPDCAGLAVYEPAAGNSNSVQFPNVGANLLAPPRGGLMGRASIIASPQGANYTFDATALDAWSDRVAYAPPGAPGASLADASPAASLVLTPTGIVAATWRDTAVGRLEAASAALMKQLVANEFVLDAGTASQTDWLVTYPTKRHHTAVAAGTTATGPFGGATSTAFGPLCDQLSARIFDREARTTPGASNIPVPTLPPAAPNYSSLCFTAVPIAIAPASLVASRFAQTFSAGVVATAYQSTTSGGLLTSSGFVGSTQGPNGILTISFDAPGQRIRASAARLIRVDGSNVAIPGEHFGLPAIGFMLHNYRNSGVTSRYGGVVPHAAAVIVQ